MLGHPCILGEPQRKALGAKSEVVNKGEQNQKCDLTPALSGAQKCTVMLGDPFILRDPQPQPWGTK